MITCIGDIHGWSDRLEQVLARSVGYLVFLGDLIDRGPDSRAVISRVRTLVESNRASCVLGNHEYAFVRALGSPMDGIAADPEMHDAWLAFYGGADTALSYGAPTGGEALRRAAADDLHWLVHLPWYISGRSPDGRRYIACHAGLSDEPWDHQRLRLINAWDGYHPGCALPVDLYAKDRVGRRPVDLPDTVTIMSGHVPMAQPLVTPLAAHIDTTGGGPGRRLTGYIWPEGRIITS